MYNNNNKALFFPNKLYSIAVNYSEYCKTTFFLNYFFLIIRCCNNSVAIKLLEHVLS